MSYLCCALAALLIAAGIFAGTRYDAGYSAGVASAAHAAAASPSPAPAASDGGVTIRKADTGEVVGSSSSSTYNGQIVVSPVEDGVAPLSVETSGAGLYYVSLARMLPGLNGGAPVPGSSAYMSFIVHGGQSVEVMVPLGEYKIYYATGTEWHGRQDLFGPDTVRYACEDTFTFSAGSSQYNGWEITLYAVPGGNMDTERIPAADFPN